MWDDLCQVRGHTHFVSPVCLNERLNETSASPGNRARKRCHPSLLPAHTVQLKPISSPSGSTLGSHLMSFMDVPQYELPLLQQTAPLSSADTQLEHPIKECKNYPVHISVMKYPRYKTSVRQRKEWCEPFKVGAGEERNRGWLLLCSDGEGTESHLSNVNWVNFWKFLTVHRKTDVNLHPETLKYQKCFWEVLRRWDEKHPHFCSLNFYLWLFFLYHTGQKRSSVTHWDEFIMWSYLCIRAQCTAIW